MATFDLLISSLLPEYRVDKRKLNRVIKQVFSDQQLKKVRVNVVLTDDVEIIRLNKQYLNNNSTTDVLSFLLELDNTEKFLEGEVYANLQQIERQAAEYKVNFETELFRIVIHGILHLVGYDDQSPQERKKMHEQEDYYLSQV